MTTETSEPDCRFIETPEPGIYRNVPADVYHSWDAMSNSRLKWIISDSLRRFRYEIAHPSEPSEAMMKGTILHALCLEPLEFNNRFAIAPSAPKNTKAGKAAFVAFVKASEGMTLIPRKLYQEAVPMARALMRHPQSRELLADGEPEVSIVWIDADTGIKCKARLDYLLAPILGDIKSARNIAPFAFSKACNDLGYHNQGAFYLDGAKACGLPVETFNFAAVESHPPWDVVVYAADELMITAGRLQYKRALNAYSEAVRDNRWPGRNETHVQEIALPRYTLYDEQLIGKVQL